MDGYAQKGQFYLGCCCCELTNLCRHHSDVMPRCLLPVQNLSSSKDTAVNPDGEIQRLSLFIFYKIPVMKNYIHFMIPSNYHNTI